jgi:hypothetical protein
VVNTGRSFIYIQAHVYGNPENGYTIGYTSDMVPCGTLRSAYRRACQTLGHDDFIVGEFDGESVIALFNGPTKEDARDLDAEELRNINDEFGMPHPAAVAR